MKTTLLTLVNEIVICDSVNIELQKLRLLQTFMYPFKNHLTFMTFLA
jgi:hypothetical protein